MVNKLKIEGVVTAVRKDRKGFQLDKEGWYSGFTMVNVNWGDKVVVEYVINGNFNNIESVEILDANQSPKRVPQRNGADSQILSYVKDLVIADKVKLDKFTDMCLTMKRTLHDMEALKDEDILPTK